MHRDTLATRAWIATCVLMVGWPFGLFILATVKQQQDAAHQVTYWLHHVIAIPAVVALGALIFRDMVRSGRSPRKCIAWIIITVIVSFGIVVFEHQARPELSVYMVNTSQGDAAAADEAALRKVWNRLRINPGFSKLAPADILDHQDALNLLAGLTKRPPATSNGMDWSCDIYTFFAAFLLVSFGVIIPISASQGGYTSEELYKRRVIGILFFGLLWIPLRLYADFHEHRIMKPSEDMFDPFSALGIIIMLSLALLVALRYGAARLGITLKEYVALCGTFSTCIAALIPSAVRNEPFQFFEKFLSAQPGIVLFGSIFVLCIFGFLSFDYASKS